MVIVHESDFDFDHFAEKVILISDHFENGDF